MPRALCWRNQYIAAMPSTGAASRAMTLLLVAEESAGIQALRAVSGSGHRLRAVMTTRRDDFGGATVAAVADRLATPVWPASLVTDPRFAERIAEESIDILLNVHSLFVAHGDVVSAPRLGSFNLHPGPLPRYAGLNAPSWAIYAGEDRHGVTLHWMYEGIDTGPIAYQSTFAIEPDDTGLSVTAKCVRQGIPLIGRLLEAATGGRAAVPALAQDAEGRTYHGREVPSGGRLDWSQPAARVVDFVRACDYGPFRSPWGHPLTSLAGEEVGIVKAARTGELTSEAPGTPGEARGPGLTVAASDEWVLVRRVLLGGHQRQAAELLPAAQCTVPT